MDKEIDLINLYKLNEIYQLSRYANNVFIEQKHIDTIINYSLKELEFIQKRLVNMLRQLCNINCDLLLSNWESNQENMESYNDNRNKLFDELPKIKWFLDSTDEDIMEIDNFILFVTNEDGCYYPSYKISDTILMSISGRCYDDVEELISSIKCFIYLMEKFIFIKNRENKYLNKKQLDTLYKDYFSIYKNCFYMNKKDYSNYSELLNIIDYSYSLLDEDFYQSLKEHLDKLIFYEKMINKLPLKDLVTTTKRTKI